MIPVLPYRYAKRGEAWPLTAAQLGAVRGEFARLGYRDPYDRDARLAASARLLAIGDLDSTKALTTGQAGCLYRQLCAFASRPDLDAVVSVPTFRESLRPVLLAVIRCAEPAFLFPSGGSGWI